MNMKVQVLSVLAEALVVSVALSACSDGDAGKTDNAERESGRQQVREVAADESPLPSTSGTSLAITPKTTLFALSESKTPETKKIGIKTFKPKTDDDLGSLLGGHLTEFDIPNAVRGVRADIRSDQRIKHVDECNNKTKICRRIPFSIKESGDVVFFVQENRFYAVVREE